MDGLLCHPILLSALAVFGLLLLLLLHVLVLSRAVRWSGIISTQFETTFLS